MTRGLLPCACFVLTFASAPALAGAVNVEVSDTQSVTVVGSGESLRSTITELCAQAGVELRGYGAEDRAFDVRIEDQPLSRVFERLLRDQPYMVGVRGGADGASRVTWLRVMGTHTGPAIAQAVAPTPEIPVEAPATVEPRVITTFGGIDPQVAKTALSAPDAAQREAAAAQIAQHYKDDSNALDELLARDAATLVEEIGDQEHAVALFHRIQSLQADSKYRWKIEGIVRALQFRAQAAKPKVDYWAGGTR